MSLTSFVLNLLFPPVCASCKKEGDFLCAECLGLLARRRIGRYAKKGKASEFRFLDGVIYALDYAKNPQIQAAIHQFKYKFNEELALPFARLIGAKMDELSMVNGHRLVLVPVPLHPKRLRERGFNQAEVIANAVQRMDARSEIVPMLSRVRETRQQAKLNREGRLANLREAFSLNKKIVQKWDRRDIAFLVDDVCTTGSTLDECAKVLKGVGAPKVYGLVIARAFK